LASASRDSSGYKRHFRVVNGPLGRPFRILPFDPV
jgi:hypothetical protein